MVYEYGTLRNPTLIGYKVENTNDELSHDRDYPGNLQNLI